VSLTTHDFIAPVPAFVLPIANLAGGNTLLVGAVELSQTALGRLGVTVEFVAVVDAVKLSVTTPTLVYALARITAELTRRATDRD